jgi:hypothetical protein
LGTLLQPHLINEVQQIFAPIIMIIAMIIFIIILSWIKDDHITNQPQKQTTIKKSTTYAFTQFIASYKRTFSH